MVLEKILKNPLNSKEIKPVYPKGNQSWIFIGRANAGAETAIFSPPHVKKWLIRKDPDSGKDQRLEKKGTTEDEMVGWHHWLDGHGFEQTLGVDDGQGSLMHCSPWGHKESDTNKQWTEQNSTNLSLQGQKPKGRRSTILKPGKRRPQVEQVRKEMMKRQRNSTNEKARWKLTRPNKQRGNKQSTWKRTQNNGSKDIPKTWK